SLAAAGLVCNYHLSFGLYGRIGDWSACILATGTALTVGYLRIVSDEHWPTDVFIGGAIGVLSGYVLPQLMHFHLRGRDSGRARGVAMMAAPMEVAGGGGLQVVGAF